MPLILNQSPRILSRAHLIQNYHTTWGDFYLAVMALYRRAMDDGNFKFVLLSGSCIPVKSFTAVYNYLTKDDSSFVPYQPHFAQNEMERSTLQSNLKRFINNSQRNIRFIQEIDIKHWFYNETWVILNAPHVDLVLEHHWLLDKFRSMECFVYDENFVSYVLSKAGQLDYVVNRRTTFANWRESEGDESGRHPKTYTSISPSDLGTFKPYLFARKVSNIKNILSLPLLEDRLYKY